METSRLKLLLLATIVLYGCGTPSAQLWPGSKYTEADRTRAMLRALAYVDRSATAHFESQASDYLYCFYSIAATARDPELRAAASRLAPGYAKRWADKYSTVPANASADDVADLAFGWL